MKSILSLFFFLLALGVTAQEIAPGSTVYISFVAEQNSVDANDALDMFKKEITKLTSLEVMNNKKDAELEFKLHVLKSFGDIRKARIEIFTSSGEKLFETKWKKAGSTFQYGMSGTRGAIVISIRKELLKKYPNIKG